MARCQLRRNFWLICQVKSKQSSPNQCKPNQSNPNQVAPLQAKSKSTPVQINSTQFSSLLSPSPRAEHFFPTKKNQTTPTSSIQTQSTQDKEHKPRANAQRRPYEWDRFMMKHPIVQDGRKIATSSGKHRHLFFKVSYLLTTFALL